MNAAAKQIDGTRPTAANTPGWRGNYPPWTPKPDLLTQSIDIQGFSHTSAGPNNAAIQFHNQNATKPTFGSECCSCNTMRDEDIGAAVFGLIVLVSVSVPIIWHSKRLRDRSEMLGEPGCESSDGQSLCTQRSFSADCAQEQTSVYDNPVSVKTVASISLWCLRVRLDGFA